MIATDLRDRAASLRPFSLSPAESPVTLRNAETTITLEHQHLNRIGSGAELANQLKEMVTDGEPTSDPIAVNLDLQWIERITSVGLNELIGINAAARSRGIRLVLLNVSESVREVFSLTRLERMFEFGCSQAGY